MESQVTFKQRIATLTSLILLLEAEFVGGMPARKHATSLESHSYISPSPLYPSPWKRITYTSVKLIGKFYGYVEPFPGYKIIN